MAKYKTEGKYQPTNIDPEFLVELSHLIEIGNEKHKDSHWKNGVSVTKVVDAIKRHTVEIERGHYLDPDTGLPHSVAIAANAQILSHYIRNIRIYKPFFDLPFAEGYCNMADDCVPGSYTEGRVDQVLRRGRGAIQEPERPGGTGGPDDSDIGPVPHGRGRASGSDLGETNS